MQIGFVLFPEVTQLDFTGPLQVLCRLPGATCHVIAETPEPVQTDCPLKLVPSTTFDAAPKLDVLCVPGGPGVAPACRNDAVVNFIRRAGADATYVTSVCTGAFLLGRAGLLEGKQATTHWAYTELLPLVGAVHSPGRVVTDGNTVTGGGVTAGIDFALTLVAQIAGEPVARTIQLALEYDPAPPFSSGHPDTAEPDTFERMDSFYQERREVMRSVLNGVVAS